MIKQVSRVLLVAMLLAFACFTVVRADEAQGIISGTITDNQGNLITNATIRLQGTGLATPRATTSGKSGTYHFSNVPDGAYSLTVAKEGWTPATVTDIFLGKGVVASRVDVQLLQPNFSSVRTIGRVVTSAAHRVFNSSTASQVVLSTELYKTQGQTSVSRLFDQTPGVVADTLGGYNVSNQFAPKFVTIRNGLAYETEQTIDGHPVANGIQGAYRTTLLNTAIFQDVEIVKGPGATPTSITGAINGTVNYRLKEPTSYPYFGIDAGVDNFGGFPYSFTATGTTPNKKLGYAFVYADDQTDGPPIGKGIYNYVFGGAINGMAVAQQPFSYGSVNGSAPYFYTHNTAVVQPLNPVGEGGHTYSQLVKLRYHFSEATALTTSYWGVQGGYPMGGGYIYVVPSAFNPGAGYTGPLGNGSPILLNEDQETTGFFYNSQPAFEAEVRTHRNSDTFLARWYSIHLNSYIYTGAIGGTAPYRLFGTLQLCQPGQGTDGFSGMCGPVGGPYTAPSTAYNFSGQTVNMDLSNSWSTEDRRDHMNGASVEWDHPAGNNLYTFAFDKWVAGSYDTYSLYSTLYYGGYYNATGIPAGARQNATTWMLRALINPSDKLNFTIADYLEAYNLYHSLDGGINYTSTFLHHDDFRFGLTYHPNIDTSLRASVGTSNTPPFAGLINNTTVPFISYSPTTGTYLEYTSNGSMKPETGFGYDLGGDFRLGKDRQTVFSTDVYLTNLKNQFYYSQQLIGPYAGPNGTHLLYANQPNNISNAKYYGLEYGLYRVPSFGLGFTLSGALMRAYTYDLPPDFYNPPLGTPGSQNTTVIAGQNFTIGGVYGAGNAPYSQGNAEINYRTHDQWFFSFGETYHGPNNPEQFPAFFVARAAVSKKLNPDTTMQLNIDNLFNTYSFPYELIGTGIGVGAIPNAFPAYNNVAAGNGLGPRIIRFSVHKDIGRPGT